MEGYVSLKMTNVEIAYPIQPNYMAQKIGDGLHIYTHCNAEITSSTIHDFGWAGLVVYRYSWAEVSSLTVSNIATYGITCGGSTLAFLPNCKVQNCYYGVNASHLSGLDYPYRNVSTVNCTIPVNIVYGSVYYDPGH